MTKNVNSISKGVNSLKNFLEPTSIAIVGASEDFTTINGKIMSNLINNSYTGSILPVNPKYKEIAGYKCYSSLTEIEEEIDLAVIAVSYKVILKIIDDCYEKGIKHLMLVGSGFAEVGEEGLEVQNEIYENAKKYGISILGPNCLGVMNVRKNIPIGFATAFETEEDYLTGNVGFVSQSGAIGFSLFSLAQEENIGFDYVVSTGNQMDLNALDFMQYMLEDENISVVGAYVEEITDGAKLIKLAQRSRELKKPLVIMKSGTSEVGKEAAMSHTASVAGSHKVFKSIAKQYGITVVRDIDDLIDTIKIFSREKLPEKPDIITVSSSGAAGISMADYTEELDLNLVKLSKELRNQLEKFIPEYGSTLNPIDITAQIRNENDILNNTIETIINSNESDVIVIHTTFGGELGKQICEKIVDLDQSTYKSIIVTLTGTEEITGIGREILQKAQVPIYLTSYRTMKAVKNLVEFSKFINNDKHNHPDIYDEKYIIKDSNNEKVWTEERVKTLLSKFDIQVPKGIVADSKNELRNVESFLSYPLVSKVINEKILHKTDVGGVELNIDSPQSLMNAYENIDEAVRNFDSTIKDTKVLVEEMILEDGIELLVGVKHDEQFGSLIVCGIGGVFIEVLQDISIRKNPISENEAMNMLKELKGYELLEGVRGKGKKDINSVVDTLVTISKLAHMNNNIKEMDINPLLVLEEGKGSYALDGLMVWKNN